jgi:hypothetical protein
MAKPARMARFAAGLAFLDATGFIMGRSAPPITPPITAKKKLRPKDCAMSRTPVSARRNAYALGTTSLVIEDAK